MDLRRLEYFLAVVEHGRVTVAATELHVAQPSLSQAIRALERDLGAELFVRNGRGLVPTPAGLALIEPARRVLRDLAAAKAAVGDVIELAAGWLDIAAHDRLGFDPLAPVLAAFHRRYAGVPVRLHEPRTDEELHRMLIDGRCELALTYATAGSDAMGSDPSGVSSSTVSPPDLDPGTALVARRLGAHEIWVVLPPGGEELPDPLPLAALDGRLLVDSMTGFGAARTTVRAAMRAGGIRMRSAVRTRHLEAITPLVVAGAGIAFTSPGYAREAVRAGAVARRLEPGLSCDFLLLHRAGGLSPAAREFVSVLLAELGLSSAAEVPVEAPHEGTNSQVSRVADPARSQV